MGVLLDFFPSGVRCVLTQRLIFCSDDSSSLTQKHRTCRPGSRSWTSCSLSSEAVLCVFRSLCCLRRTRLSCQEEDVSSTPPSRCQPAPQWAVDPGAPRCWCCPPQVNDTPECDVTAPLSDFSFHHMFFDPLLASQSRSRSSGATCGSGCCSACWWPPWSDCCSPPSLTAAGRRRSLGTEQL